MGTKQHRCLGMQEPQMIKFHGAAVLVGSQSPKAKDLIGLPPRMLTKSTCPDLRTPSQLQPSMSLPSADRQPVSLSTPPGLPTKADPSDVQDSGQGQGDVFSRLGIKEGQVIVGAPQFLWLHLPSPNPASSATCCTLTQSSLPLRASGACCWNCPAVHGPDA